MGVGEGGLSSQTFNQMHFRKIRGVRRGYLPIALELLEKDTGTSDYKSSEPLLKFITSPFLYRPYITQFITYNPCPDGYKGGGDHPQRHIFRIF